MDQQLKNESSLNGNDLTPDEPITDDTENDCGRIIGNCSEGSRFSTSSKNQASVYGSTRRELAVPLPEIIVHKDNYNDFSGRQMSPSQSFFRSSSPLPQSFRRRSNSLTTTKDGDQNESKVLVIYTGGTIGMIRNEKNSKYYSVFLFIRYSIID